MGKTRGRPYDDSGMALAIVMGVITLMVLLATGAFYFASQTLFQTQMAAHHDSAFQAASSGIVVAFADLRSLVASGTSVTSPRVVSGSIAASSATYVATSTFNAAQSAYDCTSTGITPDGTEEVVVACFSIVTAAPGPLPYGSDVFYFAGGYQAGSVNGEGVISGALFILLPPATPFPTVDFGGNMSLSGGPIYVQNGNFIGNSAAPLTVYTNGTATGTNITRKSLADTLTVTPVDLPSFQTRSLVNASRQSTDNLLGDTNTTATVTEVPYTPTRCAGADGPYKVVGTTTSTVGLTIIGGNNGTASFGNHTSDAEHDDFAYDAGNHKLYIEGTVYVWGDVTISQDITYSGNGTIVCTGVMSVGANVVPSTSDGTPDARHLLCGFSSGTLMFTKNNTKCVGAFYAVGAVDLGVNQLTLVGSFTSEGGVSAANNSLMITAVPLIGTYVAPGLPNLASTSAGSSGSPNLKMTMWRRI